MVEHVGVVVHRAAINREGAFVPAEHAAHAVVDLGDEFRLGAGEKVGEAEAGLQAEAGQGCRIGPMEKTEQRQDAADGVAQDGEWPEAGEVVAEQVDRHVAGDAGNIGHSCHHQIVNRLGGQGGGAGQAEHPAVPEHIAQRREHGGAGGFGNVQEQQRPRCAGRCQRHRRGGVGRFSDDEPHGG